MWWAALALGADALETGAPVVTGSSRVIGLGGAGGAVFTDPTGGWRNPASSVGGWSSSRIPRAPDTAWDPTFRLTGWMGVLLRQMGPPGVDDPGIRTTQGLHLLQAMHAGLGIRRGRWTAAVLLRTRSTLRDEVPDALRRRADTSDSSLVVGREGRVTWGAGPVVRVDRLCGLSDFAAEPVVCGPRRAVSLGLGVHGGVRAELVPERLVAGLALESPTLPVWSDGDVRFTRAVAGELAGAVALTDAGLRPGDGEGRAVQILAAARVTAPSAGCTLPALDDRIPSCSVWTVWTVQPSLALEAEPLEDHVRLRGGAYLEPSRVGSGPRPHLTAGTDIWIGDLPGPLTGLTAAFDYGWRTGRQDGHYVHGVISPTALW